MKPTLQDLIKLYNNTESRIERANLWSHIEEWVEIFAENKYPSDYETCVALKELGYPLTSKEVRYEDKAVFVPGVLLYSAQKWLREEKKIVVLVGFDFCPFTSEIVYNWVIVVNGNTAKKSSYTYDYFEEALSEGIKEAVKILKDGKGI